MRMADTLLPAGKGAVRGRLAPSPTGFLHLGNAWALWAAWASARARSGQVALRIEDIDPHRAKPEYAAALVEDLAWLGIDWDYGPDKGASGAFFRQSERFGAYAEALSFLEGRGLVYPCFCTRKELREIAGAPHVDDAGAPYPGTCRALTEADRGNLAASGRKASLRLFCPEDLVWRFDDAVMGPQAMTLGRCGGDFALRRSDGVYAYQLAVVVDDMAMGITEVVRGNDILASTPRQLYLYSLFGGEAPRYAHLPLVTDDAGERLAKRHASLTVRAVRMAGVRPETLLGWFAVSSGLREDFAPLCAGERPAWFSLTKIRATNLRLPPDPVARFLALQKKQ